MNPDYLVDVEKERERLDRERDNEITNLKRELEKALDTLEDVSRHLTAHAEANAALHLAQKVRYSPLSVAVDATVDSIKGALSD